MSDVFKQQGAFSWCELMTTDVAAAKDFYRQLLGWEFRDQDIGEMIYTVLKAGDQERGGLMAKPPNAPMPPAWFVYVTVDDVEASVQKTEALGGKVLMPPHDIPNVGKIALIQDSQGATLYLISYLNSL